MTVKTVFITTTGSSSFSVPNDWTDNNTILCIGGGGGGSTSNASFIGAGGGAGGAAYKQNLRGLTPGGSVTVQVGAGGAGGIPGGAAAVAGGDTWFNGATLGASRCGAKGGSGATIGTQGAGGSGGTGDLLMAGGPGGTQSNSSRGAGGGGGAAGYFGNGAAGGSAGTSTGSSGGGAGAGDTALGSAGVNATTSTSTAGGAAADGTAGGTGGGAPGASPAAGGAGSHGSGGGGGQGSTGAAAGAVGGQGGAGIDYVQTSNSATAGAGGGGGGGGCNTGSSGNSGGGGAGGLYGGGGGGAGWTGNATYGTGGAGAQGIIIVTYDTAGLPPDTSSDTGYGRVPGGLWFPYQPISTSAGVGTSTFNASGVLMAYIGRVYLEGRGANGSKTLSQAGGGKIHFSAGAVTFANAGSTIDVGIQGVDSSTGIPVRGNGSYSVKKTLTGGTDTITANAMNNFGMTSGTVTLSHGDLIAIVFSMTARGGADSVVINTSQWGVSFARPSSMPICAFSSNGGSSYLNDLGADIPAAHLLQFDDGTFGAIANEFGDGCTLNNIALGASESWTSTSNPVERGAMFQVPWDCKIDAFWFRGVGAALADPLWTFYTDPLGTPTIVYRRTLPSKGFLDNTSALPYIYPFPAEIVLTRNTNYCLAFKPTTNNNWFLTQHPLFSATFAPLVVAGATFKKVTRNTTSGAFTAESPALTRYYIGFRITALPSG